MLVHAFVTSRVDYCNAILAEASKSTIDKLQRVMNAAARVVTDTQKYNPGLTNLLHDELHMDRPSSLGSTFPSGCNTSCVQRFIAVCSTRHHTTWKIASSLPQILLVVSTYGPPAAIMSCLYCDTAVPVIFGRRAFSVAGPVVWNSLPEYLRDPTRSVDSFCRISILKTSFLALPAHRGLAIMRYINLLLTLTLTCRPDE